MQILLNMTNGPYAEKMQLNNKWKILHKFNKNP